MALEEISFNNVNGDEINLTNLVSQMIDFYEQKEKGETELTDFKVQRIYWKLLQYSVMQWKSKMSLLKLLSSKQVMVIG